MKIVVNKYITKRELFEMINEKIPKNVILRSAKIEIEI